MKNFLKYIDFKSLKKQKQTLLKTIEKSKNKKEQTDLTGILNMIDEIQRIAVDEQGYREEDVFTQ
jgi:hypothetical protein